MESLQSQLLISSPALIDPNFRRTVVLLTSHDENGAMGLVLSRPSEVLVADVVPELAGLPGLDEVVYAGGPVQPEVFVALAEFDDVEDAAGPVVGNVGFVAAGSVPDDLAIQRMRIFAGYAGWSAGQIEEELQEKSWILVAAEPGDAFATDPDELWRTVLNRKGGSYTLIAAMPFDPSLN